MRRAALIALLFLVACSGKQESKPPLRGVRLVYALSEAIPADRRADAADAVLEVIRRRIDALKLRDVAVYRRDDRLYIELPNPPPGTAQTVRAVIGRAGRLEFRAVVTNLPAISGWGRRGRGRSSTSQSPSS